MSQVRLLPASKLSVHCTQWTENRSLERLRSKKLAGVTCGESMPESRLAPKSM